MSRPSEAGHPARHGFVQCFRCGCWRRDEGIEHAPRTIQDVGVATFPACRDSAVCSRLADVGDGRIDAVGYDANGSESP